MCIYYGNNDNLSYSSQEHIFPATIGGMRKLPIDYVSDEANKYFSKLESELVTNSIIGFEKMFFGPGARGKNKLGRMPISLLKTEKTEELGFSFQGKPIVIPQIRIEKDLHKVHIIRNELYQSEDDITKLITRINNFDNKYIFLDVELNESLFIIALYNKNLYIATKNKTKIEQYISFIKKYVSDNINFSQAKIKDIEQPRIDINMSIDTDNNSRIFAKTALNVLADIKGAEYINNVRFNNIKQSILGLKENEFKQLPLRFSLNNSFNISNQAHSCIFLNNENKFCAVVVFYNFWGMKFEITEAFDDCFNLPYAYICDWQNNKEGNLVEFIS